MILKDKIEIKRWLSKYKIKNYELIKDKNYGYVVNVDGYVNLIDKNLKSIDVKFNCIDGDFDCSYNKLTSLIGCPEIVKGDFDCGVNELKILNGSPKIIEGFFNCFGNQIESLIGCPEIVNNGFYCRNNKLTIKGIYSNFPKEVKNNYISFQINKGLGKLQYIEDFNELKKMLTIYQEKADLMKILEVTDKSVKSTIKI